MGRGPSQHVCVDCLALPDDERPPSPRPAPHGGPRSRRCHTHSLAERKRRKERDHEAMSIRVYGLEPGEYTALYEFQGGRCAICQIATGSSKALANDHDHNCCPGGGSCGKCLRGLLCSPCNLLIGRYSPAALTRALEYIRDPPMARFRRVRTGDAGMVIHLDRATMPDSKAI